MTEDPRTTWLELSGRYTSDQILAAGLFDEIHKKYTSSHRHYHNLVHISDLLRLSCEYDQYLQDKDLVSFSIFYHDIIYNVLRKDNEPRSAVLAVKRLTALGVPVEKREAVKLFIEATQTHTIPDTTPHKTDLAFFLDFDMAILAAPWEQYYVYTSRVRKEYRVYPDIVYKAGRKQFLQRSLQAATIFHTPVFKKQYEAQARANMEKELQSY